ncbi:hypothetical protein HY732_05080 [Candidatus Uhrbacteria bacterium]|nr:hypothetical protein [Candidatus Uhrbacteria bacterium]
MDKKDESFYFDDCDICKMTKQAEEEGRSLSKDELLGAFKEQKKKQKAKTKK